VHPRRAKLRSSDYGMVGETGLIRRLGVLIPGPRGAPSYRPRWTLRPEAPRAPRSWRPWGRRRRVASDDADHSGIRRGCGVSIFRAGELGWAIRHYAGKIGCRLPQRVSLRAAVDALQDINVSSVSVQRVSMEHANLEVVQSAA
jgi:hypothetical protein